jgi:hypothetical protein
MPARLDPLKETGAVSRIAAWLPVDSIGSARRETQERFDRMGIGQKLLADVIAKLEDGSFLVDIAGLRTRMQLPADTRVGQKLTLALASRTPQPSFQIEPDTTASTASLSPAARLIDTALLAQRDQNTPPVIAGKTPLMNRPSMPAPQIAGALRQTIVGSGLFYEAHVADWANGKQSIQSLAEEPQQQFKLAAEQQRVENGKPGSDQDVLEKGLTDPSIADQTAVDAAADADADTLDFKPALMQLVSAQLDLIEHHRLAWQGEAWPGQTMTLEIARQGTWRGHGADDRSEQAGDQTHDGPDAAPVVWQTSLKIDLPALGKVTAQIHLIGACVMLDIEGQADALQLLQKRRPALALHLESAGLGLSALTVSTADP